MNADDLRFVLSLHDHGTLVGAADKLGVSHTTVARRIAALEEELGSRLFAKGDHGRVLTVAGEQVVNVARRVEEQLATLDRELLGQDANLRGKLRVTTIDALAFFHAEQFGAFSERYPAVDLELSVDNRAQSLTKREADVAIRITNRPPEHLVGRKIGRLKFATYASEKLIASREDPCDLSSYPWVSWTESETGPRTRRFLASQLQATPSLRVDSVLSMLAAIRAGVGASLLGCLWADRTEELRRIRDLEPDFGVDLWCLTHPDLRDTARIRAFMDHFYEAMQPFVGLMAGAEPRNSAPAAAS